MAARHASPLQSLLVDDAFDGVVYPNEPMARHTTYRIGGPARFLVQVDSIGALTKLIQACEEADVPWMVVGRGSNLLVSDEGFPGVIIVLGRDFRISRYDDQRGCFSVGAGVTLSSLVQDAYSRNLAGLEFAVGTPGTVGGAVRMNAGTRDQWIGHQIISVTVLSPQTGLTRIPGSQIEWGYRTNSLPSDAIILECEVSVKPADPIYIRGKMEASLARRRKTQPLNEPSCGSVFKNPEGSSVAQMIENLGLKGLQVGDAQVSPVHGNFIVNKGSAKAQDVCALISHIHEKVSEEYGIELQPEVRFVGF